jgi:hypothetical protein
MAVERLHQSVQSPAQARLARPERALQGAVGRRETAEAKAERLIAEELEQRNWTAKDLELRRKNDPGKLAIGVRLRRETTLSIKAIAARVYLGTFNTANANLHKAMKATKPVNNGQATLGI